MQHWKIDPVSLTLDGVLAHQARVNGDKLALISAQGQYTYAQLAQWVDALASGLLSHGVGAGTRVGLLVDKCPEMIALFFACARIGAVVAPINFKLKGPQLIDLVSHAQIRHCLVGPNHRKTAQKLEKALDLSRSFYLDGPGEMPGVPFSALSAGPPVVIAHQSHPDDICYLNYTSGSTGKAKGALTSHRQIQWNAKSTIDALGMTADDVFMGMFTAFSHPHELFHRPFNLGATAVLLESWNPRVICHAVAKYRVSWMMAVPSLYAMMRQSPHRHDLSSLRVLEAGGAYVGATELAQFEAAFGAPFIPVWGSTETTGVAIALLPDGERPSGSIGKPTPDYDFEIRDDGQNLVPVGEVGHLWVKGPAVVRGYLDRPEADAAAFYDGWYRTGDLVRQDASGYFYFISRECDMLKVGGLRVYPLEVELALLAHPLVEEAVVVAAEDRIRGQVPRAVVVLSAQAKQSTAAMATALRLFSLGALAGYKVPRTIEIWPEIPKLPNGKVDKGAVKAQLAAKGMGGS